MSALYSCGCSYVFYQDTWFWLIFHLFIEGCVDVVWFCCSGVVYVDGTGFVFCEVMYLAIPKKKDILFIQKKIQFYIVEITFVDIDIYELNNILRINKHTQVSEDDDKDDINVEDCDRYDNDEIEEENNVDQFTQHECVMP